jgi:hypothetical protein
MAHVLMEIRRPGRAPTVDEIKAEYGLSDSDLDTAYGVVLVDPRDGTYAIRVDESAVEKLKPGGGLESPERGRGEIRGPYSDPRIEPTGPPRATRDEPDPRR